MYTKKAQLLPKLTGSKDLFLLETMQYEYLT